jgi:predicted Zn-dependent protease with MMP-like domain
MPFSVSRKEFERLVEEALETLPEEYREYFTNVTIIVEEYPDREDRRLLPSEEALLLGLFSGVPYPGKAGFFDIPHPLPDKIILFQRNIERICSTSQELIDQIRQTLIHEVGHYFGLSEEDLRRHEE